jgi:hypothetical protein
VYLEGQTRALYLCDHAHYARNVSLDGLLRILVLVVALVLVFVLVWVEDHIEVLMADHRVGVVALARRGPRGLPARRGLGSAL